MAEINKAKLAWRLIYLTKDTLEMLYADEKGDFEDKTIYKWYTEMTEMILYFMNMDSEVQQIKKGKSNEADNE